MSNLLQSWTKKSFLTHNDLMELEEYKKDFKIRKGKVFSNKLYGDIRRSEIRFLDKTKKTEWLYHMIMKNISKVNEIYWKLNLKKLQTLQYTMYHSKNNGYYDWHCDIYGNRMIKNKQRKLTGVIFLNDDYEGGELEFNCEGIPQTFKNTETGDIVVFPSFWLHRVKPVTKGERKTLVFWVEGEDYK